MNNNNLNWGRMSNVSLKKFSMKNMYIDFEKLEKANFYIKQYDNKAEDLINEFDQNERELREFLENKIPLENFQASNAPKKLQELLKYTKKNQYNLSSVLHYLSIKV